MAVENLTGTSEKTFGIDKADAASPILKHDSGVESGVLHIRNNDDTGFAKLQLLAGTEDGHAVTFKQFKTTKNFNIVRAQADCSSALPTNTGVKRLLVVTTAGTGAVIGDLLYDNGSGSGSMEILAATERAIAVPVAFTGGSIALDADSVYVWDVQGGSWVKIGDIGNATGAVRTILVELTDGTTPKNSVLDLPAGSVIHNAGANVSTPYNGGMGLKIGTPTDDDKFMPLTKIRPQVAEFWNVKQYTPQATAEKVRVTLVGTYSAGAAQVIVHFSVPNA